MSESDIHDKRTNAAAGAGGVEPGTRLWGRYEVVEPLGESVLGHLWLCRDVQADGAPTVLRWLPPDVRRSRALLSVLHENIRRLSECAHPNVAPVRQMVYAGAEIYLVGDYAPGATLAEWAEGLEADRDGKRPTLDELLPVLAQVAEALDFVHGQGAAHGNLTPTNVFVDEDGSVRVTDFGLAFGRHTSVRRAEEEGGEAEALAVAFRAPEQRTGGDADSAADQYSLAALACWTMTGRATPADSDWAAWPPCARAAFRRALNPKPGKRFVSCGDFVRALRGERVGGRRKGSGEGRKKVLKAVGLLAAGLAMLAAGAGAVLGIAHALNSAGRAAVAAAPVEEPVAEAPAAPVARSPRGVRPLVAETPLPVEGKPWVAGTTGMQFVWVFEMQMWVGRFEVTNDEYRKKEPGHASGKFTSPKGKPSQAVSLDGGNQPVVGVNFAESRAYAQWLTEREREAGKLPDGLAYRLPTSAEAEEYIRAGAQTAFPWGDELPPSRGNYADEALAATFPDMPVIEGYRDGAVCTAEVQDSGENAWGIFGAGGNVWETASREPGGDQFGGWLGGGWDDWQPTRLNASARYGFRGDAHGMVNGFRLVLAPAVDRHAGE